MFAGLVTKLKALSLLGKLLAFSSTAIVGGAVVSSVASPANTPEPVTTAVETVESTETKEVKPVIETKTVLEEEDIPFSSSEVDDPYTASGKSYVKTEGVDGVKTISYEITYADGTETNRKKISEDITKEPVNKVVAVGSYIKPAPEPEPAPINTGSDCDSNYTGCVPISSDVDCAGGRGNGPAYVSGPVNVIGSDIYDLDGDGDGVGCE